MVRLAKVRLNRDISFVFHIMTNYQEYSLFMRQIDINSFDRFETWFRAELDHFYKRFLMIQNETGENIGFLFAYDYKELDRHAQFSTYILPEYRNLGAGIEATILFADQLFSQLNLLRLYSYVYGYNEQSLLCNHQAGFTEEGCLSQNKYYNGGFWDLHIFSITSEEFYARFDRMVQRLRRR